MDNFFKKQLIIFMVLFNLIIFTSSCKNENGNVIELDEKYGYGFYTNVIHVKDLGLRLGIREDGYYQVMGLESEFENPSKNVLIFPSHFNGIPIMGLGLPPVRKIGIKYQPYDPFVNDLCFCHDISGTINELKTTPNISDNNRIDTIYARTHHTGNLTNIEYPERFWTATYNFKKIVYMCDLFREQNSDIPTPDCLSLTNVNNCIIDDFEELLFIDIYGMDNLYQVLSPNLKLVVMKETKDVMMKSLEFRSNYNYIDLVPYFEKWFIEPNIYFYYNTSEEDEDIYWIDHNDNGETLFTPYEPYNNGKTFLGWYTEKECINEWNFETKIELGENEVLNLYAKWE